jgi:hypothetical protein
MLCRMLLQDFGIASTAFKFGIELEFYLEPRLMMVAEKDYSIWSICRDSTVVGRPRENKC